MATLRKRRGMWYARIQWRDQNGQKKDKQIPLRTTLKVTARERLPAVNRVQADIKDGLSYSFPWMNDAGQTKILVFTVKAAMEEWMEHRKKNKIRKETHIIFEILTTDKASILDESRLIFAFTSITRF